MCAYRFGDSFDKYGLIAEVGRGGYSQFTPSGNTLLVAGRFGGQGLSLSAPVLVFSLGADLGTIIVGFALKRTVQTTIQGIIANFIDVTTSQITVESKSDGRIEVKRGATVLGVTTFSLPFNVWVPLEMKVVFSNTGSVEIRVDTTVILNLPNVDTTSTANNTASTITFGPVAGNGNTWIYDDLRILDTTGPQNNNFLGDVRFKAQFPTGAGAHTEFGVVGAASNFDAVNDPAPGDDTKYVFSSTPNQIDTYPVSDVLTTDTILAVQRSYLVRKTDAGPRLIKPVTRIGGVDYVDATGLIVLDTFLYARSVEELSPATGLPYTANEFNGAEYGEKVV